MGFPPAAAEGGAAVAFDRSATVMLRSQHVVFDSVPRKKLPSVAVSASS